MTVQITCPNCNLTRRVPQERVPREARWASCPRCRTRFEIQPAPAHTETPIQAAAGEGKETARGEIPPWERRLELGMWQGLAQTLKAALFRPARLFSGMSADRGLKEPLAYGLLLGSLGTMFSIFWQFLSAAGGVLPVEAGSWGTLVFAVLFLACMLLTPFLVVAEVFLATAVIHVLLRLVRGGGRGFEATFRVVAYSQTAQILGVVPFVGGMAGGLWMLLVQVVGLREIHETSYPRVIVALLLPLVLILALIAAVAFPLPILK